MGFFFEWPNQHKMMKKTGEKLQNLDSIAEHNSCSDISWFDILYKNV